MSSKKTTHYQLHAWEPGDTFLRAEFNENFAKLDQIPEIITGSYTGTGANSQTVTLGWRPKAVLVMEYGGRMGSSSTGKNYGGLAMDGYPVNFYGVDMVLITDTGFRVGNPNDTRFTAINIKDGIYYYLAVKA